jgi:tetratricopeptide (TPR) repeat protein
MSPWAKVRKVVVCFGALLATPLCAQPSASQLDASPALFSVLAAINATGYNDGLNSPNTHPLRAQMRQWVAQRKPASLAAITRFREAHRADSPAAELSQYVTFALSVSAPPDFKPRFSPDRMPPEAAQLEGFAELIARFHQEAEIDEAFRRAQPSFEQVIERYHRPVAEAVFEANAYLRNPTSGMTGRRFQVVIDLLGAPNFVLSRSLGDDYSVVVTASPEPRIRDIRHAYLDYLIDPLAIRNSAALDKRKDLGELALASPLLGEAYRNDFVRLAGMCAVNAVEARLDRRNGPALVERFMSEGFILTAYFYEALSSYEKQEQSFRLYFPTLVEGIDVAKEDKRIAQVQFASERAVRKVQAPPPPQAPELAGAELLVARAEDLYTKRDLPAAAAIYRQALQASAPKPIHAKAMFGLARIAALEKNPELSQQLFERLLELDPEPFERAWTFVYLARLARAAQDPPAAAKYYQTALAVAGASEGVLKAAQSELASLQAAPPPRKDP